MCAYVGSLRVMFFLGLRGRSAVDISCTRCVLTLTMVSRVVELIANEMLIC